MESKKTPYIKDDRITIILRLSPEALTEDMKAHINEIVRKEKEADNIGDHFTMDYNLYMDIKPNHDERQIFIDIILETHVDGLAHTGSYLDRYEPDIIDEQADYFLKEALLYINDYGKYINGKSVTEN